MSADDEGTRGVAEDDITPSSSYDKHLLELDRMALDQAYVAHLIRLFSSWMSDSHHQPQRAMKGANQARRAYIAVMNEIKKREQQ